MTDVLWPPPTELRVNRWWQVDWWQDLRYVAWHLTFEASPSLHRLVAEYQRVLERIGGFALIPSDWLHLTVHGVGVSSSLSAGSRARALAAARERLASVPAGVVTFDRIAVHPEALGLCPSPASVVHAIRGALRLGLAELLDESELEPMEGYVPHVTIAHVTAGRPAAPVLAALDAVSVEPVEVRVREVALLEMYLGDGVHRWEELARVPLRPRACLSNIA